MRVTLHPRLPLTAVALLVLTAVRVQAGDLDVLLFESLDAGPATFAASGAKIGFDSLAREGGLGLLTIGESVRVERRRCGCGAPRRVTRIAAGASAQAGYQWTPPEGVVAAFAGVETWSDGLSRLRTGLRVQAEAWLRPSEDTLVQAVLIGGTARGSLWTRLAWGYRLWDTYLGPEASAYRDVTGYGKAAFGLHATDFVLMKVHVRASSGLQWQTGRARPAPYVALTTWAPF